MSSPQTSEPPPADLSPIDDEPAEAVSITDAQRRALLAGFRDLGVDDRGERLATVRRIIDRDVASANDLTRAEAASVLDYLAQRRATQEQEPAANTPEPDPNTDAASGDAGNPSQIGHMNP